MRCLRLSRLLSLPSRGAWIEIRIIAKLWKLIKSRSPHGERGLKSPPMVEKKSVPQSLPSRGAWIEMRKIETYRFLIPIVAPLTGSVD